MNIRNGYPLFFIEIFLRISTAITVKKTPVHKGQVLGVWYAAKKILNEDIKSCNDNLMLNIPLSTSDLVKSIRLSMLDMKAQFMDGDGYSVNYIEMKASDKFSDYLSLSKHLSDLDVSRLSLAEKKAFFINIYNTLVIHALVEGLLETFPGGSLSRLKLYATASYNIGGCILSLNDIENGILRGNRPSAAPFSALPFNDGMDMKYRELVLESCDPRIHFALNCGARSCPPIAVYNADTIDLSLDRVTKAFLTTDNIKVDVDKRTVELSMLFNWYAKDFGESKSDILLWIKGYADENLSENIQKLLDATTDPTFTYFPYDWSVNN